MNVNLSVDGIRWYTNLIKLHMTPDHINEVLSIDNRKIKTVHDQMHWLAPFPDQPMKSVTAREVRRRCDDNCKMSELLMM